MLHSMGHRLPAIEILFFKSFIAFFSLLIIFRPPLKIVFKAKALKGQILRGFLATMGGLAWITSLLYLPLAECSALSLTSTLFTTLGGILFFKEKSRLTLWICLALGFVGIFIILQPTERIFSFYAFLPLISALAFAGSSLLIKPLGIKDTLTTTFLYSMGLMTLFSFIPMSLEWVMPTVSEWFKLILIGLTYMVTQRCLGSAYMYGAASFIAPFKFARFPLSTLVGFLFFMEMPSISILSGGGLIVCSCLYLIWIEKRIQLKNGKERMRNL